MKEHGLNWGLPGGGMDFGETFADALARELKEEVGYEGEFDFDVIDAADPMWLEHIEAWQIYIVCHVKPKDFSFSVGSDGEDMRFIDPADLARHDGSQVRYAQYFHSRLQDRLSSC